MNNLAQKIEKLRTAIDNKGLAASVDKLHKIIEEYKRQAICSLLLMRPYHEEDEYLDEMYMVIHAVESFPEEVFLQEFVSCLEALSRSSPYFLTFLIGRILNSDSYAATLTEIAKTASPETRGVVVEFLRQARKAYRSKPDISRNSGIAIKQLSKST